MKFDSVDSLKVAGFVGFKSIKELINRWSDIPLDRGIYMVLYTGRNRPKFVVKGTGGFFEGKDPNVPVAELDSSWVDGSVVIYVGRTGISFRKRFSQLFDFGQGKPAAHYGGRYIWQIQDREELSLCWLPCPNGWRGTEELEDEIMHEFKRIYGKLPFANLLEPKGKETLKQSDVRLAGRISETIPTKKKISDEQEIESIANDTEITHRIVLVDGSNIGWRDNKASLNNIDLVDKQLQKMGFKKENIIVICDASFRHDIGTDSFDQRTHSDKRFCLSPAREQADSTILSRAYELWRQEPENPPFIITNDKYDDYFTLNPKLSDLKKFKRGVTWMHFRGMEVPEISLLQAPDRKI